MTMRRPQFSLKTLLCERQFIKERSIVAWPVFFIEAVVNQQLEFIDLNEAIQRGAQQSPFGSLENAITFRRAPHYRHPLAPRTSR